MEAVNISGWRPRQKKSTSLTPRGDGCTCKQTEGMRAELLKAEWPALTNLGAGWGVGTVGLAMDRVLFRRKENSTFS